jgi:hypothetical protein
MAKVATRMMGARVPPGWASTIELMAREQRVSPAEICRRAIGLYIGVDAGEAGEGAGGSAGGAGAGTMANRLAVLESWAEKSQAWIDECEAWGTGLEARLRAKFGEV